MNRNSANNLRQYKSNKLTNEIPIIVLEIEVTAHTSQVFSVNVKAYAAFTSFDLSCFIFQFQVYT
jgi:hypothetical protein